MFFSMEYHAAASTAASRLTTYLARMRDNDPTLTSFNLGSYMISFKGAKAMAAALKVNHTLTSIDCGFHGVGIEGAKAIARALEVNRTLTSIKFGPKDIGDEGAKAIAKALKVNTMLNFLGLWGNNIGVEGAKAIAEALKVNHTLTAIYLGSNELQEAEVQSIIEALQGNDTLTSIVLSSNRISVAGAKAIVEALSLNRVLTSLNFWHNDIDVEAIKIMVEVLSVNDSLTSIGFRRNSMGIKGAKVIAEALRLNPALTSIDLRGNEIGNEGAKAIAEALKENHTLTSIDLEFTHIGDEGAVAIAEALKVNHTLAALSLHTNCIYLKGVKALAKALKVNRTLTSIHLDVFSADQKNTIVDALENNVSLIELLSGIYGIDDLRVEALLVRNRELVQPKEGLKQFVLKHDNMPYNVQALTAIKLGFPKGLVARVLKSMRKAIEEGHKKSDATSRALFRKIYEAEPARMKIEKSFDRWLKEKEFVYNDVMKTVEGEKPSFEEWLLLTSIYQQQSDDVKRTPFKEWRKAQHQLYSQERHAYEETSATAKFMSFEKWLETQWRTLFEVERLKMIYAKQPQDVKDAAVFEDWIQKECDSYDIAMATAAAPHPSFEEWLTQKYSAFDVASSAAAASVD